MNCILRCINESWHDWFVCEKEKVIAVFNIVLPNETIRVGEIIFPTIKKKIEYEICITLDESEKLTSIGLHIDINPLEITSKITIDKSDLYHKFDVSIKSTDTLKINGDILIDDNRILKGELDGIRTRS